MNRFTRSLSVLALAISALFSQVHASDLSITANSFLPGANAKKDIGIAGATLAIGQLIYLDSASQTWKLADANLSAAAASVSAIAASAGVSGQPFIYVYGDNDLTLGATLSMTAPVYCLSATAGGICPAADLSTGYYPAVVLIAKSTTKCIFNPTALRGPAALSALLDLGFSPRLALVPHSFFYSPAPADFDRPRPLDRASLAPRRGFPLRFAPWLMRDRFAA